MPAEYEITAVESTEPREWTASAGATFHAWRVTLKNAEGRELANVEMNKKPGNLPEVGQKIYGEVDTTGSYGPKFKNAPRPGQQGFGNNSNGGGSYDQRDEAISRAVAFKGAVELLAAAIAGGDKIPADDLPSLVGKLTADLLPIVEGKAEQQSEPASEPEKAALPADSDIPF